MRATMLALVSFLFTASCSERPGDELTLHKLTIRDEKGCPRIELVGEGGVIRVLDPKGVTRVEIKVFQDVDAEAALIALSAAGGDVALELVQTEGGAGALLYDQRQSKRVALWAAEESGLSVRGGGGDRPGRFMINAVCNDQGSEFEVTNIDRWVRIVAPADERKTRITVEDDEKTRWQAPQD